MFVKRLSKRSGYGASIGEGILWIAFFGVVLISAVKAGQTLFESMDENRAAGLLRDLKSATRQIHAATSQYGNNKNLVPTLIDFDKVPADALDGEGAAAGIIHPFGGKVSVLGGPSGKSRTFAITFHSLDDGRCANLAGPYTGAASKQARLVNISFNGSLVKPGFGIDAVTSGCSAGDDGNKLTWTFR